MKPYDRFNSTARGGGEISRQQACLTRSFSFSWILVDSSFLKFNTKINNKIPAEATLGHEPIIRPDVAKNIHQTSRRNGTIPCPLLVKYREQKMSTSNQRELLCYVYSDRLLELEQNWGQNQIGLCRISLLVVENSGLNQCGNFRQISYPYHLRLLPRYEGDSG